MATSSKKAKTANIPQKPRDLSMTKTPSTDITDTIKKKFIEFYSSDEVRGNVSIACDAVGLGRSTYYEWLEKDEAFRNAVKETKLRMCDDMEQVLVSRAIESSDTALIYWLKNNHEGYKEKATMNVYGEKVLVMPSELINKYGISSQSEDSSK